MRPICFGCGVLQGKKKMQPAAAKKVETSSALGETAANHVNGPLSVIDSHLWSGRGVEQTT